MKTKNVMVLLVIVMLSVLTAVFGTMPNSIVDFLGAFGVSFCFWFLMLLGAFDFEKERDYSKEGWNEKFNR
jgi:uncharacterized membrane protein